MRKLGDFLRSERLKQGFALGDVARLVGYRNINKGVRRIMALERTGAGKSDLLVNIASTLHLDWMTVESLAEEDRQQRLCEWEAWVNEPVPMELIVRVMAAVYARHSLPAEVTTPEQAEAWACEFARDQRRQVCLILSRRHSVWIDAEGQVYSRTEATPGEPNSPFMTVKGRRFLLDGDRSGM